MHTSIRLLVGSGAVAALFVGAAGPAQAQTAAPATTVLSVGHVDVVDVEYEDGALEIGVHDESVEPSVEYEASDVTLLVKKQAKTTVPDDPAYRFLGKAGNKVWILPEVQDPNLLWAGFSTEELVPGVFTGDAVSVTVEQIRGPGDVAVFTQNAVGEPNVLVNSGDGLPDTLALTTGAHLHTNWAFEKAGVYRFTVRASATLADTGAAVTSEPVVYTFRVQR